MDRDVIGTCSPSIFVDVREEAVVPGRAVVRDSNKCVLDYSGLARPCPLIITSLLLITFEPCTVTNYSSLSKSRIDH
jgi:hypothetical protein